MIRPKLLTVTDGGDLYIGEQAYESVGEYEFEVPLSVNRIHACAIGAGGKGSVRDYYGGGGGGLVWANDIEVTPGEKLLVIVAACGDVAIDGRSGIKRKKITRERPDPDDYDWILWGDGGSSDGSGGGYGSSVATAEGGYGGQGSEGKWYNYGNGVIATFYGAGGGAGGYRGNGGAGVEVNQPLTGGAPNSGAAGGGSEYWIDSGSTQGSFDGGVGGGVGIKGRGATGSSQPNQGSRNTAKDGSSGSGGDGKQFGGGSSGNGATNGGHGAVRIIWGIQYSYPDNADVKA